MSEVTINLNMLSPFMKYGVVSNLNSTLAVTIHQNGTTISISNQHNQTISLMVDVITRYITSMED